MNENDKNQKNQNNPNLPRRATEYEDYFGIENPGIKPIGGDDMSRFEVHIEDEPLEIGDISLPEPQYKGEIYFSNRKAKKTTPPAAPVPVQALGNERAVTPTPTPTSINKPSAKAKKKKRSQQQAKFLAVFFLVVGIATVMLSALAISCLNDVVAIHRSDELVTVNIPKDADTNEIIDILAENDLIEQKAFCKFFCSAMKIVRHKDKSVTNPVYLSGVYYVKPSMGIEGLLNKFKELQKAEKTVSLVFPEGWTIQQMVNKLSEYNVCSKEQLLTAIKGAQYEYPFLTAIAPNASRTYTLEGYFFPDTYEFFENSDANSVIRKFLENFQVKWSDEYEQKRVALGLTVDEVMIIASIIQREAADTEQMALISSVIHNRLDRPVSWPTLGCDSTSDYITKYIAPNVSANEALIFTEAYDTGINRGLPPGPICNPGISAIEAALNPESTNYFYFCHDKYGKIYMASTQSEFDQNLLKVLRANND